MHTLDYSLVHMSTATPSPAGLSQPQKHLALVCRGASHMYYAHTLLSIVASIVLGHHLDTVIVSLESILTAPTVQGYQRNKLMSSLSSVGLLSAKHCLGLNVVRLDACQ